MFDGFRMLQAPAKLFKRMVLWALVILEKGIEERRTVTCPMNQWGSALDNTNDIDGVVFVLPRIPDTSYGRVARL